MGIKLQSTNFLDLQTSICSGHGTIFRSSKPSPQRFLMSFTKLQRCWTILPVQLNVKQTSFQQQNTENYQHSTADCFDYESNTKSLFDHWLELNHLSKMNVFPVLPDKLGKKQCTSPLWLWFVAWTQLFGVIWIVITRELQGLSGFCSNHSICILC